MAPEKKALIVLFVLSVANIMAGLATNSWVLVLHTLSIGFVGSCIFYFCVVYIPERQKRKAGERWIAGTLQVNKARYH